MKRDLLANWEGRKAAPCWRAGAWEAPRSRLDPVDANRSASRLARAPARKPGCLGFQSSPVVTRCRPVVTCVVTIKSGKSAPAVGFQKVGEREKLLIKKSSHTGICEN